MLGIVLLYVGAVLLINGVGGLGKIDKRSVAVLNLFVGAIAFLIDVILLWRAHTTPEFYAVATGLLFAFTYLYVGITNWFDLDGRGLGWYCLFVGLTTVPCSVMSFQAKDMRFGVIWLIWGVLWLSFYLSLAAGKNLGKWLAYGTIAVGIGTCWIPGYLMLIDKW
jgi:hypothetical protein